MTHYQVTIAEGVDIAKVRKRLANLGDVDDCGCECIPRLVNVHTERPKRIARIPGVESVVRADTPISTPFEQALEWEVGADHSTKDSIALAMLSWPEKLLDAGNVPVDPTLSYDFDRDGEGVDIYHVDTRPDIDLPEFQGRASVILDLFDGQPGQHGTMMAGHMMSDRYGVAKRALLWNATAFDATGSGAVSHANTAMNAALQHYLARAATNRPAVMGVLVEATAGLGPGGFFNAAISAITSAGMVMVSAAGNKGSTSLSEPAKHGDVFATGNCLADERRASSSNYGAGVGVYACGGHEIDLSSTTFREGGARRHGSGTSSASALATGAVACFLTGYSRLRNLDDVRQVYAALLGYAKQGRVTGIPSTSDAARLMHKPAVLPDDPLGIPAVWVGLPDPPPPEPEPEPEPEPHPEPAPDAGFFVPPPPTDQQFIQTCIAAGGFITFVDRSH